MDRRNLWIAIFLGLVIPWILLSGREMAIDSTDTPTESLGTMHEDEQTNMICVLDKEGSVQTIELEKYILGVVIGEMPEDFAIEALKAQAVVARTFVLKNQSTGWKHENAAVCMDSSCCQNYKDPDSYQSAGGELKVYLKAVELTAGQILTYDGDLIEATYFSCSGGRTEDAQAVWGTDYPYLRSVESPGEETAAHFTDTVTISASEFQKKMGVNYSGMPGEWIGQVSYTAGGGVDTIYIGGVAYSGVEIRRKLGLYSSAFIMNAVGERITITTKGFGHRVGMSQYGADAMAVQGNLYDEILAYYYPGTCLQLMSNI